MLQCCTMGVFSVMLCLTLDNDGRLFVFLSEICFIGDSADPQPVGDQDQGGAA